MVNIGIQLYSVREEIKNKGFAAVLKEVAEAGFNSVEFAGFYDHTPEEVVKMLKDNDLRGISAHIGLDAIEQQLPYIDALGMKYVYIPGIRHEDMCGDKFPETVKKIEHVKKLLDERGIVFGYHNHAHEYVDGGDKVAELIGAVDGFTSELDIFWAKAAGHEPTELMKKYGKSLSALHIKEMDKRTTLDNPTEFPQAVPGEGISGCEEAFRLGKKMGITLYVLECEFFPGDVMDYLKKSAAAMDRMAR